MRMYEQGKFENQTIQTFPLLTALFLTGFFGGWILSTGTGLRASLALEQMASIRGFVLSVGMRTGKLFLVLLLLAHIPGGALLAPLILSFLGLEMGTAASALTAGRGSLYWILMTAADLLTVVPFSMCLCGRCLGRAAGIFHGSGGISLRLLLVSTAAAACAALLEGAVLGFAHSLM